jgi:hypothetical protein
MLLSVKALYAMTGAPSEQIMVLFILNIPRFMRGKNTAPRKKRH